MLFAAASWLSEWLSGFNEIQLAGGIIDFLG